MISIEDAKQLATAVASWSTYDQNSFSPAYMDLIRAYSPMFKYEGQMFRTIFLFDKGDIPIFNLEPYIMSHKDGGRIASWSKTIEGMERWDEQTSDDIEFEDDEEAIHQVLCTQSGRAFDITAFSQFLAQNYPELNSFPITRAAEVEEVVAPYYAASFSAEISHTYENHMDYDEDDEDDY